MTYPGSVVYAPSLADIDKVLMTMKSRLCGLVVMTLSTGCAAAILNVLSGHRVVSVPVNVHVLNNDFDPRTMGCVAAELLESTVTQCRINEASVVTTDNRQVLCIAQPAILGQLLTHQRRRGRGGEDALYIASLRPYARGVFPRRPRLLRIAS